MKTQHLPLKFLPLAAATAALLIAAAPAHAGHVYGGIIDTNGTLGLQAGDALSFVNQTTGAAVTSLTLTTALVTTLGSPQFGMYLSTGPTFTALTATGLVWSGTAYLPANAFAARAGASLYVSLANVTGPTGAQFSFWDDGATSATSVYTVGTGLTLGTGRFSLTNNGTEYPDQPLYVGDGMTPNPTTPNGSTDPYGHIHGRTFAVDRPGTYTVSYILRDAAGIQADSAPFTVTYTAVPEPGTIALFALTGIGALAFLRRCSGGR